MANPTMSFEDTVFASILDKIFTYSSVPEILQKYDWPEMFQINPSAIFLVSFVAENAL